MRDVSEVKQYLENGHCYLGLRPTVNTALIPLLSHPIKDKIERTPYVRPGTKFAQTTHIISE